MNVTREHFWYCHPDDGEDADGVAQYRMEAAIIWGCIFGPDYSYRHCAKHIGADDFTTLVFRETWLKIAELIDSGRKPDHTLMRFLMLHRDDGMRAFKTVMTDSACHLVVSEGVAFDLRAATARRAAFRVAGTITDQAGTDAHPDKVIDEARAELDKLERIGTAEPVSINTAVNHLLDLLEDNTERLVITGVEAVDSYLCGVRPGSAIAVAGRSGGGKTALGMQTAVVTAKNGGRVLYFSYEMDHAELSARALAHVADINPARILNRSIDRDEADVMLAGCGRLAELPLSIIDDASTTIDSLVLQSKRLHAERPLSLIVVDYLGIMPLPGTGRQTLTERIATVTRELKQLARDLGCVVMTLCQVNREGARSERLTKSCLRDSSTIENDNDQVWLIQARQEDGRFVPNEIEIAKYRQGDETRCLCEWVPTRTRFK